MFTAIYLQQGPLAALGLAAGGMDDLEGALIVLVPVLFIFAIVWLGLGFILRHFFRSPSGRWFWPLSAVSVLAPFFLLLLATNVYARL